MTTERFRNSTFVQSPFDAFGPHRSATLTGTLRKARLELVRVGMAEPAADLRVELPPQDAFYLVFQLREQPAHDYWVDGCARIAPPSPRGSLHIADLNARHSARLRDSFDSLNMLIPRDFLAELAEDVGACSGVMLDLKAPWRTPDARLEALAPALVDAIAHAATIGPLFADQLTIAMTLHLAEHYGGLHRPLVRPGRLAPWQERRAREIIAANLVKEASVADVAAQCGLSVSHFTRAFKASVGTTPHGWLQSRRLDRAKHLLSRTDLPLAAIAAHCGFADQSHFTRTFKRATSLAPGAWRRMR
ncbi:AraC family transcriptional regulator [Bradyrhizobium sp. SSBR45G]|uniref:AraC family transcriptional regulator n=1 Tax=unclassified Bradyrhizobium TaxID=2631580 RepID=UPI002342ACE6|nr:MULTISPECIES: AraC family transcriptional regulator [unclassified Bradyrhizobium]GLH80731.1 AraC family transcriptional regulator [Bradyrhizobium sp. SSBR45G]GLH88120.1 AraC family transcriptional regulator [Bradyrhizobium sp. SSBR45R]